MKHVVVGGDGWVARTAISHLVKNAQIPQENIEVYGSFERDSNTSVGNSSLQFLLL